MPSSTEDEKRTIGEMTDEEARLVLLRVTYEELGVVPDSAVRRADGGYTVTLTLHTAATR